MRQGLPASPGKVCLLGAPLPGGSVRPTRWHVPCSAPASESSPALETLMKRVMIAMCAATALLVGCGVGNEESEAEVATAEVETAAQPILLGTTIDQCSSVLKVLNTS